jgi:uncharacterized DUF497 family protein
VEVTFNPHKNERNIRERKLPFERAQDFDFETAVTFPVQRHGETRLISVGYLDKRLHLLCYTETDLGIRVISFRRVNKREAATYGKAQTID